MKRISLFIYSLILIASGFVHSCKDENSTYPQVSISAPLSGGSYSFGDTIRVAFEVVNKQGQVSVDLMNGGTPVSIANKLVNEEGNHFEYELYFTDRYLPSGNYDIRVQAFNGNNSSSDFLEITYHELPLRMRGLVALSGEKGSNFNILRYDSLGNILTQPLTDPAFDLEFNSFQQVIAIASSTNGNLFGYSFSKLSMVYGKNATEMGRYNDIHTNGPYIFALESSGGIKGFHGNGTLARSYEAPEDYVPEKACAGNPGLLISAKLTGRNEYALFLLNPQNGAVLKTTNVPGKVAAMDYAGSNLFILAYRDKGDAVIATYEVDNNILTDYYRLIGELPLSLVSVDPNQMLISTDSRILRFAPHLPAFPIEVHNFAASDMEYDEIQDHIYYASGNSIMKGTPGANVSTVLNSPDSIHQIEIAYNK